jgi:hypothetical protein
MDFHALQHKLFDLDPSDPKEDLAKLQNQAQNPQAEAAPTKNYLEESVSVKEGSLPLDINSVSDFAALAGVRLDEKQKTGSAGQAKGKDRMPKTSTPSTTGEQPHPLKDKLVGENDTDLIRGIQRTRKDVSDESSISMVKLALERAVEGQVLTPQQRDALGPYVDAMVKILSEPRFATIFDNIVKMANKEQETNESGLQYYTGVKKYGKEGMTKIQSAAGKGANHEEIGKIKDKYDKTKKSESIAERLTRELNAFSKSKS